MKRLYSQYVNPLHLTFLAFILIFVNIDFTIGGRVVDILPDWLGVLFLMKAFLEFGDNRLKKLLPLYGIWFILELLQYFIPNLFPFQSPLLVSVGFLVPICCNFIVLTYLYELSVDMQCYQGEKLGKCRNFSLILDTIVSVLCLITLYLTNGFQNMDSPQVDIVFSDSNGPLFILLFLFIILGFINYIIILATIFNLHDFAQIRSNQGLSFGKGEEVLLEE